MDFSKLTLGDKILGGTAIALVIDLLFFPWHSIDTGTGAWQADDQWTGQMDHAGGTLFYPG